MSGQNVGGKRFLQERGRRLPKMIGVAGHEENLNIASACEAIRELKTIHPRHLEIGQDETHVRVGLQHFKGLDAVPCLEHKVAVTGQDADYHRTYRLLVLDNEHGPAGYLSHGGCRVGGTNMLLQKEKAR